MPVLDAPARVYVCDLPVDAHTVPTLLDDVARRVGTRDRSTIGYLNVHVANVAADHPDVAAFLRGLDVCYADGAGVVLGARMLGARLPGRMTGADWIHPFADRAVAAGWRVAWIGGEDGVVAAAERALAARHPGFHLVFGHHGHFGKQGPETAAVLAGVADAAPDVLLVGMGSPVQERWVAEHRAAIAATVTWCVGATADFVSGRVPRGPAVLHRNQEWLARLLVDPRRLWRRYLLGNPRFLARVASERMRHVEVPLKPGAPGNPVRGERRGEGDPTD